MSGHSKLVSTSLASHFKLNAILSSNINEDREYMVTIFYSSVMSSLMYAMVCTRPNISKLVEVVSRKMNNPSIEN